MKNYKSLLIFCGLILLGQLSQAQVVDKKTRFEAGIGMVITQGQSKLKAMAGYWITPRLVTHLWALSPQDKIPCSNPSDLGIVNGHLEELTMKMNATIGLNFRMYQKPKGGFFGGLGITRQDYWIKTETEFRNENSDRNPYGCFGSKPSLWNRTSDMAWGINSQFGYAFRLKKARFEFLMSHNYLFMKGREYEYSSVLESKETKARSINSDFALSPLSFEISYIINLF